LQQDIQWRITSQSTQHQVIRKIHTDNITLKQHHEQEKKKTRTATTTTTTTTTTTSIRTFECCDVGVSIDGDQLSTQPLGIMTHLAGDTLAVPELRNGERKKKEEAHSLRIDQYKI
jgi:hypothetical protein